MSIKVYNAFKVRRADHFWAVVRDIKVEATKRVTEVLRSFYLAHMENVDTTSPVYQSALADRSDWDPQTAEYMARISIAHRFIEQSYREQSVSMQRNPYNFDVSVGFYEFEGGIYLRTFCDWTMGEVLDFVAKDKRLRDFHYQTQTDRPKEITARAWRERRRVWDGIHSLPGSMPVVLTLDICRWDMYHQVCPWFDMCRVAAKKGTLTKPPAQEPPASGVPTASGG